MTTSVPRVAVLVLLCLGSPVARADVTVYDATVSWGGSAADGSDSDKVWSDYVPGQLITSVANSTRFNEIVAGFNGRNYYNADQASAASCAPLNSFGYPYGCVDPGDLSTFPLPATNAGPAATATGQLTVTTDTANDTVHIMGQLQVSPYDYRLADGSPFGNVWYGVTGGTMTLDLTGEIVGANFEIDAGTIVFSNPDPDGSGPQSGFKCSVLNGGPTGLPCVVTLPGMPGDYLPDGGQLSLLPIPIYAATAGCSDVNVCASPPVSIVSGVLATLTTSQAGSLGTTYGEYRRALASASAAGNIYWNAPSQSFINASTFYTGSFAISGTAVTVPATNDDSASVAQDSGATVIAVLANDTGFTDPTLAIESAPDHGGSASINPDDTVSYVPAAGFFGTETFVYSASEGTYSDSATVTVSVEPASAPTANDDLAGAIRDSTGIVIAVLANDSGFASPAVAITVPPDHGGLASVNPDRTIAYTPPPGFTGTETLTYTATEGSFSDAAVITVLVQTDVAPVAPDGSIAGITTVGFAPDTRSGNILVTDLAGYASGNTPSTVSVSVPPTRGSASVTGTSIRFVPADSFFAGTDTFSYAVTDTNGDVATGVITVVIADGQPGLGDVAILTDEDTPAASPLSIILGNGSRAQHRLEVVTDGADGQCTLSATEVVYTPNPGFSGNDTCVLRVEDGDGSEAVADVQIRVNAPPSNARPDVGASSVDPRVLAFLLCVAIARSSRSRR